MTVARARLLFCWELGANFGHLSNLALLRKDLEREGFDLYFAVPNLQVAREVLGPSARLLQAPAWPDFIYRGPRLIVASFGDILTLAGFSEPGLLAPIVDAWSELFALVRPTSAIVDHAPGAHLAARIARLPSVAVGTGFTLPPLDYPSFPALRADLTASLPEARLLQVAQDILAARGQGELPKTLPQLFRTDTRLPIGLPELDPYRSFRRESFYAPAMGFTEPLAIREKRLFVYLGSELPHLSARMQVIGELDIPVTAYIRGGDPTIAEFLRLRGKTVLTRPAEIRTLLPSVSHVLSQGGAMLASEALAAGRPHFMLPMQFEASLNANLVTSAGYGRSLPADRSDIDAFREQLRGFIADEDLSRRTLDYAKLLAQRPLPSFDNALLATLRTLVPASQV